MKSSQKKERKKKRLHGSKDPKLVKNNIYSKQTNKLDLIGCMNYIDARCIFVLIKFICFSVHFENLVGVDGERQQLCAV